jgi:hypothetical protein
MDETNSQTIEPVYGGSTIADSAPVEAVEGEQPVEGAEELKAEAEVQPEVKQQEEKFAAKFAALSRKEKAIRQREVQLQRQMQQLEQRLQAAEAQSKEIETYKSLPDRLKREPLKVLEESGLKFEQLAEMVLNDGKPTQDMLLNEYEKKVMLKVKELEDKLAQKELKEAEEREAAAIEGFKAQLTDFVNKTEDYELIRANDAVDVVFEVIEAHHAETGEILSNKEASDMVEEYLLEEAKKLVDREKVKKLLQPSEAPKKPVASQTGAKTLSNAQAAQASQKPAGRILSNEESKAEAAKLIRWDD